MFYNRQLKNTKRIFVYCLVSVCLLACTQSKDSRLQLELTTNEVDTIQNIKEVFITNRPELLSEQSRLLFWSKWGLKKFHYENPESVTLNTFMLDSLQKGSYTIFITLEKNGYGYSGRLDSVDIKEGDNFLKRQIDLVPVRKYIE